MANHNGPAYIPRKLSWMEKGSESPKIIQDREILRSQTCCSHCCDRENASIDWTIKENVRAKLKIIVKRTLRQYGYRPDMQLLATETVLKQAEMIANELAGDG